MRNFHWQLSSFRDAGRFWPIALSLLWIVTIWLPKTQVHWVHPEYSANFMKAHEKPWSFLNFMGHDNRHRCRFASYALTDLNIELRKGLDKLGIRHPSISLAWIWVLLFSPWVFYLWVSELLRKAPALQRHRVAVWSTAIYMVTPGVVSGVTLLFHPGKPGSQFVLLVILFLSTKLQREWSLKRVSWIWMLAILATLLDESGAFAYVAIPLMAWERSRGWWRNLGIWLTSGLTYLVLVLVVFPILTEWAGHSRVSLLSYAGETSIFGALKPRTLLAYGEILLGSIAVPFEPERGKLGKLGLLVVVALAAWALYRRTRRASDFDAIVRVGVGGLLFVVFHAVLSNRENIFLGEARSSYYYGSGISLFLPFWLVLAIDRMSKMRMDFVLFLALWFLNVHNTQAINARMIETHHWQWRHFFPNVDAEALKIPQHHVPYWVEQQTWEHRPSL